MQHRPSSKRTAVGSTKKAAVGPKPTRAPAVATTTPTRAAFVTKLAAVSSGFIVMLAVGLGLEFLMWDLRRTGPHNETILSA